MGIKKFVKKIGKTVKKVAPFAAGAAGLALGGPAIAGAVKSVMPSLGSLGGMAKGIGDLVSPVSGLINGGLGYIGQQQTNAANAANAREQMDFQREMSDTSFQRGVKDMQAAGLNPMLGYSQGGASSPSGAMSVDQNSAKSALEAAANTASLEQMEAQTEKIKSETVSNALNSAYVAAQVRHMVNMGTNVGEMVLGTRYDSQDKQMRYRANMGHEELKGTGWEADVARRRSEQKITRWDEDRAKAESQFYDAAGPAGQVLKFIQGVIGSAGDARRIIRSVSGR